MHTVDVGSSVAHLDPTKGSGLLVLAAPTGLAVGTDSLDAADWSATLRALDAMGWEPSEGDGGGPQYEGVTEDGRTVLGLYGREPIVSDPSLDEAAEAFAELRRVVGVRS